jgi:hypothetical protein
VYYRRELVLKVAQDANFQDLIFHRVKDVVAGTDWDEATMVRLDLADTDGVKTIDLGGIGVCKAIFVEADSAVDLVMDAGLVRLRPSASGVATMVLEATYFEALTVENPTQDSAAAVTILMLGDAPEPPPAP